MANNQLTRERLEKIKSWRETYGAGSNVMLPAEEAEELARMALAAMDSEPVVLVTNAMAYAFHHALTDSPLCDDDVEDIKAGLRAALVNVFDTQPAPVVPDAYVRDERGRMMLSGICEPKIGFGTGWNACRAAMLQELQKSAGAEATYRSNENVKVLTTINSAPTLDLLPKNAESLTGNSPAQSDCFPAQNHVSPEQNGDTPAQSQGWIPLSEQMPPSRHEVLVGRWWGEKTRWCCKWATYIPGHPDAQSSGWLIPGASWTPTHWMPLPAAPQEVR